MIDIHILPSALFVKRNQKLQASVIKKKLTYHEARHFFQINKAKSTATYKKPQYFKREATAGVYYIFFKIF